MKTNKPWIKLVKFLAIFMAIVILLSFGVLIFILAQQIQQAQASSPGSFPLWSLIPQLLVQINQVWNKIMFCLALLGGIQILIWLARNRQDLRRFRKTG